MKQAGHEVVRQRLIEQARGSLDTPLAAFARQPKTVREMARRVNGPGE